MIKTTSSNQSCGRDSETKILKSLSIYIYIYEECYKGTAMYTEKRKPYIVKYGNSGKKTSCFNISFTVECKLNMSLYKIQ